MSGKNKPPRRKAGVDDRKRPRIAQDTRPGGLPPAPRRERTFAQSPQGRVVVQFGRVDIAGPWCLTKITPNDHADLLGRLRSIETMTMHEVVAGGAIVKDYAIDEIPNPEAKARLVELGYDDETRMSRIQVSGPGRLYGFRRDDRFHALWWDPHHQIWPTNR